VHLAAVWGPLAYFTARELGADRFGSIACPKLQCGRESTTFK